MYSLLMVGEGGHPKRIHYFRIVLALESDRFNTNNEDQSKLCAKLSFQISNKKEPLELL